MKTLKTRKLVKRFASFCRGDEGNMTIIGLFGVIAIAGAGSFAMDVTNQSLARTHLQTAADQAAHAALYNRYLMNADEAKIKALAVANTTLPSTIFGETITVDDIKFGVIDKATGGFVLAASSMSAVRVQTNFHADRDNALKSYLMHFLGVDQFNISTTAIYSSYNPGCLNEGFIAEDVVDIQSNNAFGSGFCLHSNTYVKLSSNNTFEPGTIVSMPDLDDLELPRSGFESNDGLQSALRSSTMNIRILGRIDNIIFKHKNPSASLASYPDPGLAADTPDLPDYIVNTTPISSRFRSVTPAEIYALDGNSGQGRIHLMDCQGPRLTINATAQPLRDVVIISSCEIKFSGGSAVENVRIMTTSTATNSLNSPSGFRVGQNDGCAVGGGSQLITLGGMKFSSGLEIYGSQLMAKGDILFSANANGVQGASLIAGGEISGTSNMNMGLCKSGMEDNLKISYFRLRG